jgi:rare lipoprotein A (peptidoglycan hydrolase)
LRIEPFDPRGRIGPFWAVAQQLREPVSSPRRRPKTMIRTPASRFLPAPTTALVRVAIAAVACASLALSGGAAASALAATGGTAAGAAHSSAHHRRKPSKPKLQVATWFGPGFYGKQTACGQTLTPAVVGVANRTLPCGTLVQVTYEGHRLTVPVIDRGPYGTGASWDLTAGAAQALTIEDTVRIATRIVGSAPNTPTLGVPPGSQALEATGGAAAG